LKGIQPLSLKYTKDIDMECVWCAVRKFSAFGTFRLFHSTRRFRDCLYLIQRWLITIGQL